MQSLGDSLGGNKREPPTQASSHQHYGALRQTVDDPDGVLHPGGEGQLHGVALGLARALVVEDHTRETVHIAVPGGGGPLETSQQGGDNFKPEETRGLVTVHLSVGMHPRHHHDSRLLAAWDLVVSYPPVK